MKLGLLSIMFSVLIIGMTDMYSQEFIRGQVLDGKSQQSLVGATVSLNCPDDEIQWAVTDFNGEFEFAFKSDLDDRCTIEIQYATYHTQKISVGDISKPESFVVKMFGSDWSDAKEILEKRKAKVQDWQDNNSEFQSCTQDADCIIVEPSCCECNRGGEVIAINKSFQQSWDTEIASEYCPPVICGGAVDNKCLYRASCTNETCLTAHRDVTIVGEDFYKLFNQSSDSLEIGGKKYNFRVSANRDFMPFAPTNGRHLNMHLIVDSVQFEKADTIDNIQVLALKKDSVWNVSMSGFRSYNDGFILSARGGPKWNPGDTFQVVFSFRFKNQQILIRKKKVEITRSS